MGQGRKLNLLLISSLLLLLEICNGLEDDGAAKVVETSFILAHDAGTTYLEEEQVFVEKEVLSYTKTQPSGGFQRLLDCGVRALDIRPKLGKNGSIIMHHGIVPVPVTLDRSLREVKNWSARHPEELIILYFSHFDKGETLSKSFEWLQLHNITTFQDDSLAKMSMTQALQAGPVVAVIFNVEENYDPSIVCEKSLFGENRAGLLEKYLCFDEKTKQVPIQHLRRHLLGVSKIGSRSGGLWMLQAHWQYNPVSIAIGLAHNMTILSDNQASGINHLLVSDVESNRYPMLNLIEIDNVCDGGPELLKALRGRRPIYHDNFNVEISLT